MVPGIGAALRFWVIYVPLGVVVGGALAVLLLRIGLPSAIAWLLDRSMRRRASRS